MSEIGMLIIAFVAISAIGITIKRLKINYEVHENLRIAHSENLKRIGVYTEKHDYDLRANKIVDKYKIKMCNFKGRRGSAEWEAILCEMFCEMLEPYKHLMTKEELEGYKEKNWNILCRMIGRCLCTSRRFKGYDF